MPKPYSTTTVWISGFLKEVQSVLKLFFFCFVFVFFFLFFFFFLGGGGGKGLTIQEYKAKAWTSHVMQTDIHH